MRTSPCRPSRVSRLPGSGVWTQAAPPTAFLLGSPATVRRTCKRSSLTKGHTSGNSHRTPGGPPRLGDSVVAARLPCQPSKQWGRGGAGSGQRATQTTAPRTTRSALQGGFSALGSMSTRCLGPKAQPRMAAVGESVAAQALRPPEETLGCGRWPQLESSAGSATGPFPARGLPAPRPLREPPVWLLVLNKTTSKPPAGAECQPSGKPDAGAWGGEDLLGRTGGELAPGRLSLAEPPAARRSGRALEPRAGWCWPASTRNLV